MILYFLLYQKKMLYIEGKQKLHLNGRKDKLKEYKKEMIGCIVGYMFVVLITTLILKTPNDIKFGMWLFGLIAVSLEVKVYYMEVVKEWNEKLINKLKEGK